MSPEAAFPDEWSTYADLIAPIGARVVAHLPDPGDRQLRQEVHRMVAAGMSVAYTCLFLGDVEHPDFWPIFNQAYSFGIPNPDTSYTMAPVAGDGIYRISGFRGSARMVDFQIGGGVYFSHGTGMPSGTFNNYDLDALAINQDGSFEVILSNERPTGCTGNWLKLDPRATHMWVRQVAYDWINEVDGRFSIDRLDRPAIKPRQSAEEIESRLQLIAGWAENWATWPIDWVNSLTTKGMANKVEIKNLSSISGIPTQLYAEGLFDLGPDEALIFESEVPQKCRYWGVQLGDILWNSIDPMNRQSSLNGYSAMLDSDGKFRAVISASDPGVPNWLDTAGYEKGTIMGRWTESSHQPALKLSKVKLLELRMHLPPETPVVSTEARDAAIRLRRKGSQMRRRW